MNIEEIESNFKQNEKILGEADNYFEALGFMNEGVFGKGEISKKHKELMGLAVAAALKSDENTEKHLLNCSEAGCTRREIVEAVKISVALGGTVILPLAAKVIRYCDKIGMK